MERTSYLRGSTRRGPRYKQSIGVLMAQIQDPVDQSDDGDDHPEAEEIDVADDAPHDEGEAEAKHRRPVGRGRNRLGLGPAPSRLQRGAVLGLGPARRRKAGGGRRKWRGASSVVGRPPAVLRLAGWP